MYGLAVVIVVIVISRLSAQSRAKSKGLALRPLSISWRRLLWNGIVLMSGLSALLVYGSWLFWPLPLFFAALAVPGGLLLSAVPLLAVLARLGRPKLVYTLGHLLLVFEPSRETPAGAALFAALAMAYRGETTSNEREWLRTRLSKAERALEVFGCASGILYLLEARAARDEGRKGDAEEHASRARAILGTLTYMSSAVARPAVTRLMNDLKAALHASRGEWGFVATLPAIAVSTRVLALRGYASERLSKGEASPKTRRARQRVASPLIEGLFARATPPDAIPVEEVLARGRATFLALARGESVGLSAKMTMLVAFDALLSPDFERTAIPAEARDDADLVSAMQEEAASSITSLLVANPPPIGALGRFGPVSARVYQKLESTLFDELSRTVANLLERAKQSWRYDPLREWVDVSMSRIAFRKLEQAFGPAASGQAWQTYASAYCKLGVQLSETQPRRRPLAHAVFESLRRDAERYGDRQHLEQQRHNTRVTAGVS